MSSTDLEQAKVRLTELIDAAWRGEEVLITRDGAPVARLVPDKTPPISQRRPQRVPGRLTGKVVIHDPDWDKPDADLETLFYDTHKFLPRR